MLTPKLVFACELDTDQLEALFGYGRVIEELVNLEAGVALALKDFSSARADLVHRLNQANVPVTAWLLLPKEQGYFFNLHNAPQAAARYLEFKNWTLEHGLEWTAVGLDIEPALDDLTQLTSRPLRMLPKLIGRIFGGKRVQQAQIDYAELVAQIQADGFVVESYQFPFIVDERKAGSTLLQRLFNVVDLPADRETLMLYTSFQREYGPGILWSYAPQAQAIAVGSTGGGKVENDSEPLNWDELCRDLLIARQWSEQIAIYSLEGCVQQGFLPLLADFDWEQPFTPPLASAGKVSSLRRGLRLVLWSSAHPAAILITLVGLVLLGLNLLRRFKGNGNHH